MLVAGISLSPDERQETDALCASFRGGQRCCITSNIASAMATVALSGMESVLLLGRDAAHGEVARLGCTLAYHADDAPTPGSVPLYGPLLSRSDVPAHFSRYGKHPMTLLLMTLADMKALKRGHTPIRNASTPSYVLVHAPFISEEDESAMRSSIALLMGDGEALPGRVSHIPPVTHALERLGASPLSETSISMIQRTLSSSQDSDVLQCFSCVLRTLRNDAEVATIVKKQPAGRDVIVVCDLKGSIENVRRTLHRFGVAAPTVISIDALNSRSHCLSPARGVEHAPLLLFADTPMYEAEVRAGQYFAGLLLGMRPDCIVCCWTAPGTGDPRRWSNQITAQEAREWLANLSASNKL
jgi:hypothetical protein